MPMASSNKFSTQSWSLVTLVCGVPWYEAAQGRALKFIKE